MGFKSLVISFVLLSSQVVFAESPYMSTQCLEGNDKVCKKLIKLCEQHNGGACTAAGVVRGKQRPDDLNNLDSLQEITNVFERACVYGDKDGCKLLEAMTERASKLKSLLAQQAQNEEISAYREAFIQQQADSQKWQNTSNSLQAYADSQKQPAPRSTKCQSTSRRAYNGDVVTDTDCH